MAEIIKISTKQRLQLDESIASRNIAKTFGRAEDHIEVHIYNQNNQLLISDSNLTDYTVPEGSEGELTSEIIIDPTSILNSKGYITGKYTLKLNIQRKKVFDTSSNPFTIKEISPSRTEIRVIAPKIINSTFDSSVRSLISDIESSAYFRDFILNFGNDINILGINFLLNKNPSKHEILIKLLDPLPQSIQTQSTFKIVEPIVDPINITVDLGEPIITEEGIKLQGPNFKIDVRLNNSVPSAFKNYNQILDYSLTSSYQNLLNQLENKEIPEIAYDYIRTVSSSLEVLDVPYHFENFVHFGSATERLKNFNYKLKLIELYDSQLGDISNITGATSASFSVLNNKESINDKKEKLIKGLDGYEQFLYYNSGSNFSWPKSNSVSPYNLYSITSSEAQTWLGSEIDTSTYYGGQLLSASLYDTQNEYNLINSVPKHITDNSDNTFYGTFINMIGQHFDHIWTHIKHLTEVNDTHHTRGISKDLVFFQLKSLGIDTFDQFENSNLIEYILGEGTSGSVFYDTPVSQSFVTASNVGSIPKGDITKAIWKRLYHNAPYLLKTKGTERGIKALMSCYGVPSTLLNIKEYGGSTSDKTTYKTFSYEKSGLALRGDAGSSNHLVRFPWANNNIGPITAKTLQARVKPTRDTSNNVTLLSLEGGSTLQLQLNASSSGTDVYTLDDNTTFGRIDLHDGSSVVASTPYFPIYDGEFWNIHMAGEGTNVYFGAYKANYLKSVHNHTGSWSSNTYANNFGNSSGDGSTYLYAGKDEFSGSIQEVRAHWGEVLTHDTLKKHALEPFMYAGNTVSSSYDNLVIRLPLGSTDTGSLENHIPDTSLTNANTVASSSATTTWEEVVEVHYLPTPDTVGASMTSEKVRIDTGTIDDDILSTTIKSETSTLDRQPQDFEDLGIFFSPTTEMNEDIIYTLGAFRMDDYIGSPLPSAQTASNYSGLKDIRDIYFKKVKRRYNYWDYIKLIQYVDHTLFKMVEQWVPFKANTKTGLLIEPHYLERNKFARELPVIDYGQTMVSGSYQTIDFELDPNNNFKITNSSVGGGNVVTTNNLSSIIGSDGLRKETGTNATINVNSYILDEAQNASQAPIKPHKSTQSEGYIAYTSNTLLGNAPRAILSNKYYRSLPIGNTSNIII